MSNDKILIVDDHGPTTSKAIALLLTQYGLCVADDEFNQVEIRLRDVEPMELSCSARLQPVDKSFAPPHKKNRRGKFKRSGR